MRDFLGTVKAVLTLARSLRPVLGSISNFDETTYLKLNPDVTVAVQSGSIGSGWLHHVLDGAREGRSTENESILQEAYLPVPLANLRKRVQGDDRLSAFIAKGERIAKDILGAVEGQLVLSDKIRVLNFGCGCDRVLREVQKSYPASRFYGTDIDGEAILRTFARQAFGICEGEGRTGYPISTKVPTRQKNTFARSGAASLRFERS
jgi:hypothetical protein